MDLAKRLDVPYVRVLADKEPYPGDVDEAAVISLLQSLLPLAKEQGVTLLVETNGTYADSQRLRDLCDKVDHPSLGVLWDVHHPYRYFGESPQTTYQNLGQYIRHIHVKDSLMKDGKADYQMIGNGDVPISDAMDLLRANGYDGFVVLEWVRRWNTNLKTPTTTSFAPGFCPVWISPKPPCPISEKHSTWNRTTPFIGTTWSGFYGFK